MYRHRPSFRGSRLVRGVLPLTATMLVASALAPSTALAQACLGSPAMSSQFTLGAWYGSSDGASRYGVDSQSNLPGALSLGAHLGGIEPDGTDERILTGGVSLAMELGSAGLSVCPVAGVTYDWWSGEFAGIDLDYSRTALPLGVGVGSRVGSSASAIFIPSGRAGLLHSRYNGSAQVGSGVFSRTDSSTDPFLDADASLLLGRFYLRAGFQHVFEDDSDTVLKLGAGFLF